MGRILREPISFRIAVPAATKKTYEQLITVSGTIEYLRIRFYSGQQKALRLRPAVIFRTDEFVNMVRFAGDTDAYLSGDDDVLNYELGIAVQVGDRVVLDVENMDSLNEYSLVVDVGVDYEQGGS